MYTWILLISVVLAQAHRAPPSSSDHVINDPALNAILSRLANPNKPNENLKNDRSFMVPPPLRNLNREIDELALVPSPIVVTSTPPTLPTVAAPLSISERPSTTNQLLPSSIPATYSVTNPGSSLMSILNIPTSSYVVSSSMSEYTYSASFNSFETSVDYSYSTDNEEPQESTEESSEESSTFTLAVGLDANSCPSNTINQAIVILLCIITLVLS